MIYHDKYISIVTPEALKSFDIANIWRGVF
jgi:hypothetical protein